MKRILFLLITSATLLASFSSCGEKDPVTPKVEPKTEPGIEKPKEDDRKWGTNGGFKSADNLLFEKNVIGNGDQEFVFTGKQTLKKGVYLMKGWVYIAKGAELTIEEGSIIKGDKQTRATLIVERGGKLIAKGSKNAPIVFTSDQAAGSRKPGDWGGIVVCGNARNNQNEMQIEGGPRTKHGGTNDEDNSGILSYIRIEFAGYPFQKDKEINGLTFGSVGNKTQVDHIQVSYCNDDSFEWFGGSVNAKYLVAYHGWDDDFDTDNGFSGKLQFGLSIRNPRIADTSQSNAFESDNASDGADIAPFTTATFSNFTFVGPLTASDFANTPDYITGDVYFPNNGSALGRFQSAMQIRRNSKMSCFNSIISNWPIGLILDNQRGDSQGNATKGDLALENLWMVNVPQLGADANKVEKDRLVTGYGKDKKPIFDESKPSFSTTFFKGQKGNKVVEDAQLQPAFGVKEPLIFAPGNEAYQAASFDHKLLSQGFEKVPYIGAFDGKNNWLEGWSNFDPQNTKY